MSRILCLAILSAALSARAQTSDATETLSGVVKDPSGGVMLSVVVRVFEEGDEEPLKETTTDASGRFAFEVAEGDYRVEVDAPAFLVFEQSVDVGPATEPLEIVLELEPVQAAVDVVPAERLIADTRMSLTSETLSGEELLGLPDDEEDLARYLLLLAGADITGDLDEDILANILVDGYPDERLPRPDEISQIIIDPSSLSAAGGGPRIEIVTRPGTGVWRRSLDLDFADESLNARRPGEIRKEPRQTWDVEGDVEGPLIPDVLEMGFEVSTQMDDRAGDSLAAITPSGDLFRGVVQPEREGEMEIEAELRLSASHRLDADLAVGTSRAENVGVGGFTLPERGSEERGTEWRFRLSERMLGQGMTNSVRFQFSRESSEQVPVSDGFAINVADAFEGGGGTLRRSDEAFAFSVEDDLRWERGLWSFEWNGELRYGRERSVDRENFNGTYDFASLHDYCFATGLEGANCEETRRIVEDAMARGVPPVYEIQGREVEITGVPVTFTQSFGNADLSLAELYFATFFQGDRRIGERASLRLGVRYEGTNYSLDYLRFEPMVSFQYQLSEDTLVSLGAELDFEDFTDYERLIRNDGSTYETGLAISAPSFPDPFQDADVEIGDETASRWVLDPDYRPPFSLNPQVSVTQQLAGSTRVTLSYRGSFGDRQQRNRNINAPYPGTPLPEELLALAIDERREVVDRMRPFYPQVGNITQIETTGRAARHRWMLQVRPRGTFELFGLGLSGNFRYIYRSEHDDNEFNNPYASEWSPSRRDHEMRSQLRISMPDDSGLDNPLLAAIARATYEGLNLNFRFRGRTGELYSIESGRDLNGDQTTRDRPPGVPRNTEVGPAQWSLDLALTKDFRLGAEPSASSGEDEGRGRRRRRRGRGWDGRRLRFQARIDNVLNQTQPRAYGSVLTSPLFGRPIGYTGARTVRLSMSFDF